MASQIESTTIGLQGQFLPELSLGSLPLVSLLLVLTTTSKPSLNAAAAEQQRIAVPPQDVKVIRGGTAVLTCKVSNQVGPVQWTRNKIALGQERTLPGLPRYQMIGSSAEGEYNLEITDVDLTDDGNYMCQIGQTSVQPGQMSPPAKLTVLIPPSPPRLLNYGDLVTGSEGQTFTVTCGSENGNPAPEVKWVVARNAEGSDVMRELLVENRPEITETNKLYSVRSNLRYTPIKADDGNFLVCLLIHEAFSSSSIAASPGAVSSQSQSMISNRAVAAVLNIHYAPKVTVTLNSTDPLREGNAALLSCNVDAKPATGLQFVWLHNGNVMHTRSAVYNIPNLRKEMHHGSVYTCEVSNAVGTGKDSMVMQLQYGPKSLEGPKKILAEEGSTVSLECSFDGNPTPTYKWTKDGVSSEILQEGLNLTIVNAKQSKQGVYSCEAHVPGFPIVRQNFTLLIKGPPAVLLPRKVEAAEGSTVEIPCQISGIPPPSDVRWTKGSGVGSRIDEGLADDEKKRFSIHERPQPDGSRMSVLQIVNVYGKDFDFYNCTASNNYGVDYSSTRLILIDPIPLYVMIPGVIGGCFAILVLAGFFIWCNRQYLCNSKSSQSDDHSDVMVKVEALDGGLPLNGFLPDMYTPLNDHLVDGRYSGNGKEYMPLPTNGDAFDVDMLPPPYPHYYTNGNGTTFNSQHSPPNGNIVHVTYIDDNNAPHFAHDVAGYRTRISPDQSPDYPARTMIHTGNGVGHNYVPVTFTPSGGSGFDGHVVAGNNYVSRQPNSAPQLNGNDLWESQRQTVLQPNGRPLYTNAVTTGNRHPQHYGQSSQSANGNASQPYPSFHQVPRVHYSQHGDSGSYGLESSGGLVYQPMYTGHSSLIPKPLEPVQEVPTPEHECLANGEMTDDDQNSPNSSANSTNYGYSNNNNAANKAVASASRASSQQSTHV